MHNLKIPIILTAAVGLLTLGMTPGSAQDATASAGSDKPLAIELNRTSEAGDGCRLTFVADNGTDATLDKTSYEIAVFDANGQVARLLILEFGRFVAGKTKVVEFEFPDLACTAISRILVNTSPECVADGEASLVCLDNLVTSSRSEVVFDQ